MNGETELQNPAPSEVPKASGSLDEIVRPIVVTITRADHMRVRSMAEYHARIANKIQAAGIPLGPMVWLSGINTMSQPEIDRAWLRELSLHNIERVDVEHSMHTEETKIIIWPNAKVRDESHE